MDDLFSHLPPGQAGGVAPPGQAGQPGSPVEFAPGAFFLPGRLQPEVERRCAPQGWDQALEALTAVAPWRHWHTPGGKAMSVLSTNCGALGWVSDARGYRYQATDPANNRPWPALPAVWMETATRLAAEVGYGGFAPDSCLINCYRPETRMTLHQDRNEQDFSQPIVSWSLGMAAVFLFGGMTRQGPTQRLILNHGDVVIWGGASRLVFHGIAPLKSPAHRQLGARRINLTFRRAGTPLAG